MAKESLPRLDQSEELREKLLPHCRLKKGEIWQDPRGLHRVGVIDAASREEVLRLFGDRRAELMIHDPPYNFRVGGKKKSAALFEKSTADYIDFSRAWVRNSIAASAEDAHLYIWLGAQQKKGFQPLPDFMMMMREFPELQSRSFITLRNQRGYGTQKNWMSVRQELLYYQKGNPEFAVQYTEIPKVLKGYYKSVAGKRTENIERSRSDCIRPGNVWLDVQQVFYRMGENVPGAFAQKPLKAIDRLIAASGGISLVGDLFAHSGTTLVAAERRGISCYTGDIDPIFAELSIRRLERFRRTGEIGWQWHSPFPEVEMRL